MHTISRFFTLLVVLMMLVPSVIAAPNENANTKGLKITDLSKGTMEEVKDDKVKGLKSSSSDIVVEEKGKNHIKLNDSKPSKDKKEHKKVKVSIPTDELKSIDVDGDGKFGVLEITDDGVVINQYIATDKQLAAGIDMTFSEVEINGFSGYRSETFADVESGDVLNIADVSGDYVMTMSADGVIPTSTRITPSDASTYPNSSKLVAGYLFENNANDIKNAANGVATNMTYSGGKAIFNGIDSKIVIGNSTQLNISSPVVHMRFSELPSITSKELLGKMVYTSKLGYRIALESSNIRCYVGNGTVAYFVAVPISTLGINDTVSFAYQDNILKSYINGAYYNQALMIGPISHTSGAAVIGSTYYSAFQKMGLYDTIIYDGSTVADIQTVVAGGSGISVKAGGTSAYYTPYNVSSGDEKIISTGGAATTVSYLDTSGGTRNVTIKTYYTADTTISTETSTDDFYNASVVYSPSVDLTNGTIIRPIAPLYTGIAVLDSNNTNAVMTQNRTHYTIYTGTLAAGSWAGYNVSVPNNADHGMWLDIVMRWSSTISGWVFGENAPTDYTNDLSTELNVTVT